MGHWPSENRVFQFRQLMRNLVAMKTKKIGLSSVSVKTLYTLLKLLCSTITNNRSFGLASDAIWDFLEFLMKFY